MLRMELRTNGTISLEKESRGGGRPERKRFIKYRIRGQDFPEMGREERLNEAGENDEGRWGIRTDVNDFFI